MQILTFVTVLLMVMGIITYARLEQFLDYQTLNSHYQPYMEKMQRQGFNCRQAKNYEDDHVSKNANQSEQVPDATAKLSFSLILNKGQREKEGNPLIIKQHLDIAKQLMNVLYAKQPFFKEIVENPSLLDQLLNELMESVDAKNEKANDPKDKKSDENNKIKRIQDLAKIELQSPNLNILLCRMLQPTEKEQGKVRKKSTKKVAIVEEEDEADAEVEFDKEVADEDNCSKEGFFSLFDYITMRKGPKVRVYLASPELLEAIYGKGAPVVEQIVKTRRELANQLKNGKIEPDIANQQFEDAFRNQTPNGLTNDVLDFTVKKVAVDKKNPRGDKAEESPKKGETKGKGKDNKDKESPKLSPDKKEELLRQTK